MLSVVAMLACPNCSCAEAVDGAVALDAENAPLCLKPLNTSALIVSKTRLARAADQWRLRARVSWHVTRFRVRAALSLPCTPRIRRRMSRASSFPLHRYEVRREFQTPPSTTARQPSSEVRALGRWSEGRALRTLDDGHSGRPLAL